MGIIKEAKITSKWRVTVPKEIRDALELKGSDKVIFNKEGTSIIMIKKQRFYE